MRWVIFSIAFSAKNELSVPIMVIFFCPTIYFGIDFHVYAIFYLLVFVQYLMMSKKAHIKRFKFVQPHKEHHWNSMWTTLLWWKILVHTNFPTILKYFRASIACTCAWISCWSNKPICRIYDIFCFSAWSKHVYYVLAVEFNCNSACTKIVLIISIKFEELTTKNYWFWNSRW